ncbi:MAG: hypothetical protein WBB85_11080, partial [Albidovulum sp.]|uniref:amino acid kinase family protein n=1 Tax=Albidovulum sp. TaxID=1872424 RepID=UPI003CA6AAF9
MAAKPVDVWKFGGSSFATTAAYRHVAQAIARQVHQGHRVCLVVSAMSGTTGRLSEMLHDIAPGASAEDRDAVLGTGEILAAALVRAALRDAGVPATSLNAFQLGWRAGGDFADGRLDDLPPDAIHAAFETAAAVVISGGQALSGDRLMMLGRNSSDLSAIAAAKILGVDEVTIFSDVEGVCTADPYFIDSAAMISRLSYRHARLFAQAGAKILHERCIALAAENHIRIQCASLRADGTICRGTVVGQDGEGIQVCVPKDVRIMHIPQATGIAHPTGAIAPIRDHHGLFVVCPGAPPLPGDATPHVAGAPQSAVITIDRDGSVTGRICAPSVVQHEARHLHDTLLNGIGQDPNLTPLQRMPQK